MDTKAKKRTIPVQVLLREQTVRRLALLQVALGHGIGELLDQAVEGRMPLWRGLVILAARDGELPSEFDFEGLGLLRVQLGRKERRERERKGLPLDVSTFKRR